jgi:hypothetical protein
MQGELPAAGDLAHRALALARQRAERATEARALWLLASIAAKGEGDRAASGDRYAAAMALAGELGMRPLIAHCHLGLAQLSQGAGNVETARDHLTSATAMYQEMAMPYWLARAQTLRVDAPSPGRAAG